MKKYFPLSVLIAGFVILFASCKRYYETVPLENGTSEYIWDVQDSNGTQAIGFLYQVYKFLPGQGAGNGSGNSGYNTLGENTMLDAVSDDAIASADGSPASVLANGGLNVSFGGGQNNSWDIDYAAIRRATLFLNNFGVVPLRSPDEKRYAFGEARVLRAFFYWELVKRWGGVPLLGDSVFTLEDEVEIPRNSFAECINYIVSECDRAADSLRPDPVTAGNQGRWTKAGAMALKAKVLLYAASPLFNGGNIGDDLTGYPDYQASRWQLAANAAKAVMDLNVYQLDTSFSQIFVPENSFSVETIFASTVTKNHSAETNNGPPGFGTAALGNGLTSPTQELVDAFGMDNGLEITDPNSGYNPANPYLGRDSRFYKTILFNGSLWLQQSLQTFIGGNSRPGGNSVIQTRTGYYCRKFMDDNDTVATSYGDHYGDYIIFRYADVLMMYAEAQNEFAGPSPEVLAAVNAIRTRAKLTTYAQINPAISQDSLRTVIRQELRKEFAFEQHRYWDLRRWKIAETVYNLPLHGYEIFKSGPASFSYNLITVLTPTFVAPKMYLYPIPYNEMISNSKMVQNPGW